MKPVSIDFVPPSLPRALLWGLALLVLAIAVNTCIEIWSIFRVQAELRSEIASIRSAPVVPQVLSSPQNRAKEISEAAALKLLGRDWNQVFDAVEIQGISKFRLVEMSFDSGASRGTLEFDLERPEDVSVLGEMLSGSSPSGFTWQLDRVEMAGQAGAVGEAARVRGVWRAAIR